MASLSQLELLDKNLTLGINGLHTEFTDYFWQFCSDKLVWVPFYLCLIGYMFYRLGWKKSLIALLAIVLSVVAGDQIANLFKYSVARFRPCYDEYMLDGGLRILEARGGWYGFFSAHAANSFGVAVCSMICIKTGLKCSRKGPRKGELAIFNTIMLVWAFCTAASRIFVGKHFLGDVLVGSAVGVLVGLALGYLASYFIRKVRS